MADASRLLTRLSEKVFVDPGDRAAFVDALQHPQPDPPAVLWLRDRPAELPWAALPPLPWQPPFVDRLAPGTRPGQHPLHEAGHFYCLDFSSVVASSVMLAIAPAPQMVIDLCAAPGGKSLFSWAAFQPSVLLCNEVVRKRVKILIANLKRCGVTTARVMNLDPAAIAEPLAHSADLVIVDAPCSGQSLLAKGQKVPGCFHPVTLSRNAKRQKRILANAAALVCPGGHLAYMTCTYAPEENEQVGSWFLKQFPEFEAVAVAHLAALRSPLADWPCYRLWPHMGLGAGSFAALFRRSLCPTETDATARAAQHNFIQHHSFEIYR